ncbi:protein kinase [Strigomonas culicis]|uniref:Protein kinase n=1 Tax=Strigomonas culicis TaxID=28005 RepID=S9VVU0_9TRYP|nr:protein kinase [Strigomonas culicis]|eukprot:EPY27575.1 protein kinase [Strigomonas culicis]
MSRAPCSQCSGPVTAEVAHCIQCRSSVCGSCTQWLAPNRIGLVICKRCPMPSAFLYYCGRCSCSIAFEAIEYSCELCATPICFDCLETSFDQGALKCGHCCQGPVKMQIDPSVAPVLIDDVLIEGITLPLKDEESLVGQFKPKSKYSNFRAKEKLGEGAQGMVYKCVLEDGEVVASKELLVDDMDVAALKQQLAQTQRMMKLDHPHLIKYLDVFRAESPQRICVVMPYYSEGDLRDFIERQRRPIPEVKLCSIVLQIAGALKYLHDQNPPLMHLDVKPDNILLLNNEEQVLLMDLDLCRSVEVTASVVRRSNEPTYEYSAPEMVRSSGTPKADVFSLGVVTYVLATFPDIPAALNDRNENVVLSDSSWTWDTLRKAIPTGMY